MSDVAKVKIGNASPGVRDMTSGNIYKLMISYVIPVLFSNIFQFLYNTADTFIVGRFLGTEALAAVSSSGTLIFLMISFFNGTAMGAGVVVSRHFGAGDEEKVSRAIHTTLSVGLISGIFLTVAGVAFTPTLLQWMKTDPDVMPLAVEYFRYYFAGIVAMVMYNVCTGIMNAVGDSKRPLYYLIFSSLMNVALDLLFVGVFGWGVWSAAIATVIAQGLSFILCMVHLMKRGRIYTVELKRLRVHGDMLREIIKYGVPSGVQNSVIAFANVIVQSQINSFGKLATAAFGTHSKIEGFAFLPITSFNMATTTFVSQNLGVREYGRAKRGARFGILSAVVLSQLFGIYYYITAPTLVGLFDSTPAVIEFGVTQARTVALFYFLLAFSHSVASVCRGAGKATVPMVVMLSVWCVIRVSYIALVMHFFGKIGLIYWAYPITWGISSVVFLLYYLFSDWVHGFEKAKKR